MLSDDDVLDYMVAEAVAIKAMREEREAQRRAEMKEQKREAQKALLKEFG